MQGAITDPLVFAYSDRDHNATIVTALTRQSTAGRIARSSPQQRAEAYAGLSQAGYDERGGNFMMLGPVSLSTPRSEWPAVEIWIKIGPHTLTHGPRRCFILSDLSSLHPLPKLLSLRIGCRPSQAGYAPNAYPGRAGRGRTLSPREMTPPLGQQRNGGRFPTAAMHRGVNQPQFSGMGALGRAYHTADATVEQLLPQLQMQPSQNFAQVRSPAYSSEV